jgi:type IV pilus assembly protein PilM
MMGKKKPYFLGIDFGSSHIKVVELSIKNGRPYLSNYGKVSMHLSGDENDIASQLQSSEEKIKNAFESLLKKIDHEADDAYVSMPGFSGLITIIDLPEMKDDELEQAIRFEAHKYIPSPIDEVALSWDVVSRGSSVSNTNNRMEVMLVAALHKEVERYEHYLEDSDVHIELLELETFSLVRGLVSESDGVVLVVDIGSRASNLILVDNGVIKINRNVNSGGKEMTRTLAASLNVSVNRADSLKTSEKNIINSKESSVAFPTLEVIISEARRVIGAYRAKNTNVSINSIMLSGGVARMKGINELFSKELSLPVTIADPWRKVVYDSELTPIIPRLGPAYSVAIGLALAGFESYQKN